MELVYVFHENRGDVSMEDVVNAGAIFIRAQKSAKRTKFLIRGKLAKI